MTINSAAAFSAARANTEIGQAVALKALKISNAQQQNVLGLLQSATEQAGEIESNEPTGEVEAHEHGKGQQVDLRA